MQVEEDRVWRTWSTKLCPAENQASDLAMADSDAAYERLKQSTFDGGNDRQRLFDQWRTLSDKYLTATSAVSDCLTKKAVAASIIRAGMPDEEKRATFERYLRSGRAERDAGLVK
jgi:hypothetical protein